jgi:hypothetical protein
LESRSDSARSAASPSGAVFGGKKVRFGIKKRFRPKVRFGIKTGAFYGQEAVFIGVRARIASTDMKTAVIDRNPTTSSSENLFDDLVNNLQLRCFARENPLLCVETAQTVTNSRW